MKSYTYGTTPDEVIEQAVTGERFDMELNVGDGNTIIEAIDYAISSEDADTPIVDWRMNGDSLRLIISATGEELVILLRYLYKLWEEGNERAGDLRSSILEVLSIEEV